MKYKERRYEITTSGPRQNSMPQWTITDAGDGLTLGHIEGDRDRDGSSPFSGYAFGVFIGRYPTMIAALEGIVEYHAIIGRVTLVASNLYGETQ